MHHKLIITTALILAAHLVMASTDIDSIEEFFKNHNIYTKSLLKKVESGQIISKSTVLSNNKEEWQSMDFYVTGLNKMSCQKTLRKTAQYEEFKNFFNYIKISTYNDATKDIYLKIDSKLLPVPMILDFKIDRVDRPGEFPFTFEKGILKGLVGKVYVYKYKDQCFTYVDGKWKGKKTKFPNLVIEIFTETLSKLSLKKLFRLSSS